MKRENCYKYKKRIELNEKYLKELYALLTEYCNNIRFSATTQNDATIEFDSFDELVGYSNYKSEKIKALSLCACSDKKDDVNIHLDFGDRYFEDGYTVKCRYTIADGDSEIAFINKFKKIIDKMTQTNGMFYLGSISIIVLCFMCLLRILKLPVNFIPEEMIGLLAIFILIGPIILFVILYRLWKKLFPKLRFSIGEEIEKNKKSNDIKTNIFWGCIIASIVSIIISFLV